jgi:hypothetical protein
MFEADIHLRPLHTSILDIHKVFEPLVCCLKDIWLHRYTAKLAKLPPDLGIQVHLRNGKDATTSWLRLIPTSDGFTHLHYTYTKCLSHWYAVSRAYGCTHTVAPAKLAPDLGIQVHLRSGNDSCLRLISTSDCFINPW